RIGVVGDLEGQLLIGLVGGTSRDAAGPTGDAVWSRVFGHRLVGARCEARRVVDRAPPDVHYRYHLRALARAAVVTDGVLEARLSVEVGIRREGDVAVSAKGDLAVDGLVYGGGRQGLAALVGWARIVVAKELAGREDQRSILFGRLGIGVGNRRVVHGLDRDANRCRIAAGGAVRGLEGEAIRTVVVLSRRVGEVR